MVYRVAASLLPLSSTFLTCRNFTTEKCISLWHGASLKSFSADLRSFTSADPKRSSVSASVSATTGFISFIDIHSARI